VELNDFTSLHNVGQSSWSRNCDINNQIIISSGHIRRHSAVLIKMSYLYPRNAVDR
jgi:hypothetical protein